MALSSALCRVCVGSTYSTCRYRIIAFHTEKRYSQTSTISQNLAFRDLERADLQISVYSESRLIHDAPHRLQRLRMNNVWFVFSLNFMQLLQVQKIYFVFVICNPECHGMEILFIVIGG